MTSDLLEHAVDLFPSPEPAFERLLKRRERERRARRAVAGIVALAVAVAAIANLVLTFRSDRAPRPVDRGIDLNGVGQLGLTWTAIAPRIDAGWVGGATAGEGVLLVATNEGVAAFDAYCAVGGERCSPSWTTPSSHGVLLTDDNPQRWGAAIIADGVAYVPGEEHLSAFPLRCRTDGGVCDPSWTSSLTGDFTDTPTTLTDGKLVGSYYDRDAGTSVGYVMPATCDGSVCEPDWVAPGWTFSLATGDEVIAVADDRVAAFPIDCRNDAGTCSPRWTADLGSTDDIATEAVATDGSNVYFSTSDRLVAYPLSCSGPSCDPRWFAPEVDGRPVLGEGMVFGSTPNGDLAAYVSNCADHGGQCQPAWSAPGARPLTARDGLVIASVEHSIAAFQVDCRDDGGVCRPEWRSATFAGIDVGRMGVAVHGDVLFAPLVDRTRLGSPRGLAAYALHCRVDGGSCHPVWTSTLERGSIGLTGPIVDADRLYLVVKTGQGRPGPTQILTYGLPSGTTPIRASIAATPGDHRPTAGSAWPSFAVLAVAVLLAAAAVFSRRRDAAASPGTR